MARLPPPAGPGTEALDLRVTAEVGEAVVMKASDIGYGLGPEGSRTVVDVTVTVGGVPSPGLRLCLPVDGVRGAGSSVAVAAL